MRWSNSLLWTVLLVPCLAGTAFAQGTGRSLDIQPGARQNGMGAAGVALDEDATGVTWWNPAGLGFVNKSAVEVTYAQLVPGLATQQHVANNLDLRQLFADDWLTQPDLSGIGVAFQPDESREPAWKFWRRFSHLFDQAKYAAADLVFNGPNDLVVDVDSMFRLGKGRHIAFENLGTSPTLHHTNYFRDARVLDYLERRLG